MAKTDPLDRQMYVVIKAKFSPRHTNFQELEDSLNTTGVDEVEFIEFDFVKNEPVITVKDSDAGK